MALNLLGILAARRAFFNAHGFGGGFWVPAIFVGGIILAAQAFKGMHDGKAGTEWVLLPATPLEKYAAAFATAPSSFPSPRSLGAMALSALLALLERGAGGPGGAIWMPFNPEALRAWADYAVAAAVCLAGSAAFRKAALIKTVALVDRLRPRSGRSSSASASGRSIRAAPAGISILAARIGLSTIRGAPRAYPRAARKTVSIVSGVASYAILPAFAILFGAAKVAEKESRDEVQ